MRYLPLVDTLDWTGFTIDLVSVEVTMNFLFLLIFSCSLPWKFFMLSSLIQVLYLFST